MSGVNWNLKGPYFGNCNCAWGCPCQFNAPPTHGDCRAMGAMQIDEGRFGDVRLNGLRWVLTAEWPGAVHEGNGTQQVVIDERADASQREALFKILSGEESDEGANIFQVFSATYSKVLEPLFLPIEFSCDIDKRAARVLVPGILETRGEPMRNPISGAEHRARIVLPEGFEYTEAEFGSGTTKTRGRIKLDLNQTFGYFTTYHLTNKGVVR